MTFCRYFFFIGSSLTARSPNSKSINFWVGSTNQPPRYRKLIFRIYLLHGQYFRVVVVCWFAVIINLPPPLQFVISLGRKENLSSKLLFFVRRISSIVHPKIILVPPPIDSYSKSSVHIYIVRYRNSCVNIKIHHCFFRSTTVIARRRWNVEMSMRIIRREKRIPFYRVPIKKYPYFSFFFFFLFSPRFHPCRSIINFILLFPSRIRTPVYVRAHLWDECIHSKRGRRT